jgi:hypothetical protein
MGGLFSKKRPYSPTQTRSPRLATLSALELYPRDDLDEGIQFIKKPTLNEVGPAIGLTIPKTSREARVWNHVNQLCDPYMPHLSLWVEHYKRMVLSPHRNNRERFALFFYLTANAVPAWIATRVCLLHDMSHDQVEMRTNYDADAHRQMELLVQEVVSNPIEFFSKYQTHVHVTKQVM